MQKLITVSLIILFAEICMGSQPVIKIYDKQKDLINGRIAGISITWQGQLLLAPVAKQFFNSDRPFIWDFVTDNKGNLFVATGDGAKIYQIDPAGKSNIISHWENVEVYSLAIDNNGIVYAATSPDGKIYRFNENKKPELFANLKVKYIWDMLFDKQNKCYVATGDSGAIYVVDPQGKISIFYQSDETHIRCLAWDKNQHLLAGSYSNGYLYQFDRDGQAFVIHDSEFQEIHQICVANNGDIYVAALGMELAKVERVEEKTKIITAKPSTEALNLSSFSSEPREIPKVTGSGIIKIQPDGVIKNIWTKNADQVQAIVLTDDQALLVGTGEKGRLYRITLTEESTYLLNFEASQIVSFVPGTSGKIWLATSNLGKIYYLEPKFEKKGFFESEVIDAQTLTHWGSIHWDEQLPAEGSIKLYSRSGNTEKPNSTWSPWSNPYQANEGEVIKSPNARFLQWKLELKTNRSTVTPKVSNLKIAYLQRNLPPEVFSVTVQTIESDTRLQPVDSQKSAYLEIAVQDESDLRAQKQPAQPSLIQPLRKGYCKITWKARDINDDQLVYDLYFQHQEEKNWWILKKNLSKTMHIWDSQMMPDGHYRIKIIANDRKSNPFNTARQSEQLSDWFIIDNMGPKIQNAEIKKTENDSLQISFQVVDDLSVIKEVQFCYDIQDWLWVYPQDLVCDSKREDFNFKIKLSQKDFYSIIIKAKDKSDNIGYGRLIIKE